MQINFKPNTVDLDNYRFSWIDQFKVLRSIVYSSNKPKYIKSQKISSLSHSTFEDIPNCKSIIASSCTSIALLECGEIIVVNSHKEVFKLWTLRKIGSVANIGMSYLHVILLSTQNILYIVKKSESCEFKTYQKVNSIHTNKDLTYFVFSTAKNTCVYTKYGFSQCLNVYHTVSMSPYYFIGITDKSEYYYIYWHDLEIFEILITQNLDISLIINLKTTPYYINSKMEQFKITSIVSFNVIKLTTSVNHIIGMQCILYKVDAKIECNEKYSKYINCTDNSLFSDLNYCNVVSLSFIHSSPQKYLFVKYGMEYLIYKDISKRDNINIPSDFTLYDESEGSYI